MWGGRCGVWGVSFWMGISILCAGFGVLGWVAGGSGVLGFGVGFGVDLVGSGRVEAIDERERAARADAED